MGLSKEEFLELMVRNEFGKKTTKRNKAIREGRQKENDYNNFRFEFSRIRQRINKKLSY